MGGTHGRQYSSSGAPTRSRCKGGQENQALGRSVGGFSTKIHIRAEGFGKPMVFALTSGERHDTIGFGDLLKGGKVKRIGRGRPKSRFRYFLGDKGYSSQAIRETLRKRRITPIIPRKTNEKRRERFNRGLYRERNRVERLINRLKQFRRVATRYEKYAHNYLAMLAIAAITIWL